MRIGSLFSGIGGLELGLERAGLGETAWQIEIDPWRQRVLAKHWPDAQRLGDITEVDFATLEPIDVLCGGFPCQNISRAGDRAGLAGRLSGLWREMVRAIRVVAPRLVVVENVADLLNPGRGMGDVLGDMAALRYDADWDCIPAVALGAPHIRDRVFILAHVGGEGLQGAGPPGPQGLGQLGGPCGPGGPAHPDAERQLQPQGRVGVLWGRPSHSTWWDSEPAVVRVVSGIQRGMDRPKRIEGLGGCVVPQVAEHIGHVAFCLLASQTALSRMTTDQEGSQ